MKLNYFMTSKEILRLDKKVFIQKNLGRIFLAVEAKGEAYYINPQSQGIEYMGKTPEDRHKYIAKVGVGISNKDLEDLIK